ncbi:hypothetical protein ACOSZF_05660 [Cytobacillus firmus]|uniref:hypothetical protein n=1 Tax=Cytobacillus firmus TaxID=1399 RepID=UPI00157FF31D|nr:hypothetical protein [Cytobacillus firmus]MED1907921.1 hypothetical protein [Cytobacillus firmus]MED1942492.1 hypothetical protein [Cytobacillus firmus]NUH85824.1 hypothetical protein [Cytobacillus firmus]
MREFNNKSNKKIYQIVVFIVIAIMILGLVADNPRMGDFGAGYILNLVLVLILSVCLPQG